eukprot:c40443_g1_i1 orf=2-310(-)
MMVVMVMIVVVVVVVVVVVDMIMVMFQFHFPFALLFPSARYKTKAREARKLEKDLHNSRISKSTNRCSSSLHLLLAYKDNWLPQPLSSIMFSVVGIPMWPICV